MAYDCQKTMMVLTIISTTCAVLGLIGTMSMALKCNGKLTRKIESVLGIKISDGENLE